MKMIKAMLVLMSVAVMANAASPFDIKSNYFNATSASKWKDPSSGVTYYSGPNYEYRFKDTTATVAPWLQFQLPSARIGCNGFSIEGGFMALLGLKDIKLQLENAGPTFAWGVLTTIEISMPSVASIFQKLQQWARKMQALLQNSCQAGQMAGKWLNKNYQFGQFESTLIEEGADKIKDAVSSIDSMLDNISNLGDENNSTKKAAVSEKVHQVGSGLSFLAMDFGKALTKCRKNPEFDSKDKVDFTTDDIIKGRVLGCDIKAKLTANVFDRNRMSYMLSRALFGELVVTPESITPIVEMFKNGTFNEDAVKRSLKSVVTRSEAPFGKIEYSVYPAVIGDPQKAALFLVHGKRDQSGAAATVPIPNLQATFIRFKLSAATADYLLTDANGSVEGSNTIFATSDGTTTPDLFEIRAMYVMRPESESSFISDPLEWKGLVEESRDNILSYLKTALTKKLGETSTNNYFSGIAVNEVDLATTNTPLLVSGMHRYLNILTMAAVEKGGVYTVMPLVDLLAQYNAELFADQLLSHVMTQIEAAEVGPNLMTTEHTQRGFDNFKKRVFKVYRAIKQELKKMKDETVEDVRNVPAIFKEIEHDMKEHRIEQIGRQ